jgi:AbrB family looped-hinge helix DNA binding protein
MEHAARNAQPLRVGPQGRVVIPAALRNALGFRPGDTVVAWTEGDRLILRSRKAVEEELLAMFQHVQGSMAEELIQERRAEAAREARD